MSDLDALRHRLDELKESVRPMRDEVIMSAADGDDPIVREIADNLISGRMTPRDVLASSFYGEFLGGRIEKDPAEAADAT